MAQQQQQQQQQQQPPASPAPARSSMPPPPPAQPYPAYAYPAYPPVAAARQIPYDQNWFRAKLVLTGLSLVWCIILLSLALALTFHQFDDFYGAPLAALWCLPLVIPTAIWDIAELITVCACGKRHGNKQGIHPGAHVGVDLVIWLASLLCVLFSTSEVVLRASDVRYCSGRPSSADQSYYGTYCEGIKEYGGLMSLVRALLAFVCLLTITHFIIFVRACIETNQRNRSKRAAVFMVPAPQMPMAMYYGGMDPRMSMAPPQLEKGGAAPAPAPAPEGYSNLAGFYAPAAPMPTQPAPARHAQGISGETAPV